MSSHKLIAVVCLVSALVALASAQSFDYSKCSSGMQKQVNSYRQNVMQAARDFSNSMQDLGAQASDLGQFEQGIEKLTSNTASLTNMQDGLDGGKVAQVYMENMKIATSLLMDSVNLSLANGAIGSYVKLARALLGANSQILEAGAQNCMPSGRGLKPAAV